MAVHQGVQPEHVDAALDSIAAQSLGSREVVLVVDGPVSDAHHQVLDRHKSSLNRVDLETNQGAGRALAVGLSLCTSTWVARADADDLNDVDRLRHQLALLESASADVCSTAMVEFLGEPANEIGIRTSPTDHTDFARIMRTRNPVNHPTAVFRRELAIDVGGYQPLPFLEDYDLWARMLAAGATFVGTRHPFVRYRADGMMARRRNVAAIRAERELQARLQRYGLVGPLRARVNRAVRVTYLRLPTWASSSAYRRVFRAAPSSDT
jgi:glycosyltransferase involved in cell wall biosynthesis